jgi:hypothetical protein
MKNHNAIRNFLPLACCSLLIGFLLETAHATQFNFSYSFDDGTFVAGTLDGTASGTDVTGVSNVSFTINGNPVGPVEVWGYDGELTYDVSFDPGLNYFWFAEAGAWDVNTRTQTGGIWGNYGFALDGDDDYVVDLAHGIPDTYTTMNDSWSLTAASVPDSGTSVLMLGLGLIGLVGVKHKLRRV